MPQVITLATLILQLYACYVSQVYDCLPRQLERHHLRVGAGATGGGRARPAAAARGARSAAVATIPGPGAAGGSAAAGGPGPRPTGVVGRREG